MTVRGPAAARGRQTSVELGRHQRYSTSFTGELGSTAMAHIAATTLTADVVAVL